MSTAEKHGQVWTLFGYLEPCPRCGGAPDLPWPEVPHGHYGLPDWQVACAKCGCKGAGREHPSAARDAWNSGELDEGGDAR